MGDEGLNDEPTRAFPSRSTTFQFSQRPKNSCPQAFRRATAAPSARFRGTLPLGYPSGVPT